MKKDEPGKGYWRQDWYAILELVSLYPRHISKCISLKHHIQTTYGVVE